MEATPLKIAVMGAGGMGGYVGGRLAQVGETVHFIARGAHLAALRQTGLRIESPFGDAHLAPIHATDDPGEIGPVDLVLFTVKLNDTAAAAERLAPMIGDGTRVVTLQNGIDSRAMIARHVPAERIAAGCIYVSAAIGPPGTISSPGGARRMTVDGLGRRPRDRRPRRGLQSGARPGGVGHRRHRVGALGKVRHARRVFRGDVPRPAADRGGAGASRDARLPSRLLGENVAVAEAAGEAFPAGLPSASSGSSAACRHATKSSMLLDLEAGKPLELPWLAGRIVDLGHRARRPDAGERRGRGGAGAACPWSAATGFIS